MTKRSSISKKTRFEVFKRDSFTCQYCGRTPPVVILEIDHILAIKNGGKNTTDNYVTSCFDCNRGKSAVPLSLIPKSLIDKAKETEEKELQIAGYIDVMKKREARLEQETWEVFRILLKPSDSEDMSTRKDWFNSTRRFVDKLGLFAVIDAMEIATDRCFGETKTFRYFCGVCWNKIRGLENG